MIRKLTFVALTSIALCVPVHAADNLLFILDASNSMWGQVDGKAKITIAKDALTKLMSDIPDDMNVALMAYGHQKKDSCTDVQMRSPMVNKASRFMVLEAMNGIEPKGKTPISYSLQEAGKYLSKNYKGVNNNIVLISDGVETCRGDPCATAEALVKANVNVKVHVVGFDISEKDRKQLACIADKGNGKYFSAKGTSGFKEAIKAAVEVVQEKPKAPPAPKVAEYFRDDFNGDVLGEHWGLINADPDSFIVENGVLTVIVSDPKAKKWSTIPNIFRLQKPMPKGNWRMTMQFTLKPQTHGEWISIGLANKDNSKLIAATLQLDTINYASTNYNFRGDKVTGKGASFVKQAMRTSSRDKIARAKQFTDKIKSVQIRLERKGRKYIASGKLEAVDPNDKKVNSKWVVLQELSSLRPPGDAMALYFASYPSGYLAKRTEGSINVDWVTIETVE